jgi:hypothetical protein
MTNDETGEVAAISAIVGVHLDFGTRTSRSRPADVRERADLIVDREGDIRPRESNQALSDQCVE